MDEDMKGWGAPAIGHKELVIESKKKQTGKEVNPNTAY